MTDTLADVAEANEEELDQEQLRAVVGAQASLRQRASTCCVCGGTDCD